MKKTIAFDIVFIILLEIFLTLFNTFSSKEMSVKFLFIPLLAAYFVGRCAHVLFAKKKV